MNADSKETKETFFKAEKKKCTWQTMFSIFFFFLSYLNVEL